MADWSDWYTKEDPSKWVLADILTERATSTPDKEFLKFADQPYPEVFIYEEIIAHQFEAVFSLFRVKIDNSSNETVNYEILYSWENVFCE